MQRRRSEDETAGRDEGADPAAGYLRLRGRGAGVSHQKDRGTLRQLQGGQHGQPHRPQKGKKGGGEEGPFFGPYG